MNRDTGQRGRAPPWRCKCVVRELSHMWMHTCETSESIGHMHERLQAVPAVPLPLPKGRTYRGHCSAHPDSTKVAEVQVLVAVRGRCQRPARATLVHEASLRALLAMSPDPAAWESRKGAVKRSVRRSQTQIRALQLNRLYDLGSFSQPHCIHIASF